MMIAMRTPDRRKRSAAVMRDVEAKAQRVDRLVVLRVDPYLAEHPSVGSGVLRHERVGLRDLTPGRTPIVGSIDLGAANTRLQDGTRICVAFARSRGCPWFVAVHERIQHARVQARDIDPYPSAILRRWQPGADLRPRQAAIRGFPDAPLSVAWFDARITPFA